MKYDTGYDRGKLLLEQHHGDCHRILASHRKEIKGLNHQPFDFIAMP